MGIALSEDIAGTVAAEDTSAAMRYRPAVSSRECELMTENAELRAKLESATGITSAIRSLPSLTVEETRELILVLSNRVHKIEGFDTDGLCQRLDECYFVKVPVETVYDPRDHAEDERQDTLRAEMRDGVR